MKNITKAMYHLRAAYRLRWTLAILASVVVAYAIGPRLAETVQAVTEIDELQINSFIRFSTSGPTFTSGSAAPSASAAKGSIYLRTATAELYTNTDGSTTWDLVANTKRQTDLQDLLFQNIFHDWAPTGLQTSDLITFRASDNSGSVVTGIDATGIKLGDVRTLCNWGSLDDAGLLVLYNEDARSLAANRIYAPGADLWHGAQSVAFAIGPGECADIMYAAVKHEDPTYKRWVVKGGQQRFSHMTTEQLQIYPQLYAAPLSANVNDYDPADGFAYTCTPGSVPCSLGGSRGAGRNASVWFLSTNNSTTRTITGLAWTDGHADGYGPVKIIYNGGPGDIVLANQSPSSLNNNRFDFGAALTSITLKPGRNSIMLYHEGNTGAWKQIGHGDSVFDADRLVANLGIVSDGFLAYTVGTGFVINGFFDHQVSGTVVGSDTNYIQVFARDVGSYATDVGLSTYAVYAQNNSTKASGTGTVTRYGGLFSALDYALVTATGLAIFGSDTIAQTNVTLNNTSGSTTVKGAIDLQGNIADSTGSLTFNDDATVSGTLDVTGALNTYTQVTKTSGQDVTNAGLTNDSALSISVAAGQTYALEVHLIMSGNDTTGDGVWDLAVAAGTANCYGTQRSLDTALAFQATAVTAVGAADTSDTAIGVTGDAQVAQTVDVAISCNTSNTTTLKVRFGNNAADAGRTTRMMAGSYVRYRLVN